MSNKFFLTTAIAYPNAKPHLGFVLESIEADALARFKKMEGQDVFFLTGTDEHGQKMMEKAKELGQTPQETSDQYAAFYRDLKKTMDIDYSDFIRTTEERHIKTAQDIWNKLNDNGDLYKKQYKGLYCVGCEEFKMEKDLVNGKCPEHDKPLVTLEEENYFFRLSKYTDVLIEKLESGELGIIPSFRKNEIVNVARSGLLDVSFSRPKSSLPWGIEVPNNPSHVMYVWCDALTNYLSGAGYADDPKRFEKYWPADLHMIGKGISRFHALIWPAMLISAGLPLPKKIFIHEYVTANGKKMSKSIGNVVDPDEVLRHYGSEALRFFLLKEATLGGDIDFTWIRFHNTYEAELVNGVGNLANRILVITQKYLNGRVPKAVKDPEIVALVQQAWHTYRMSFNECDFKGALESCLNMVYFSNRYMSDKAPWNLFKTDPETFKQVMFSLLEILANVAIMLHPFIPQTSLKIQRALGVTMEKISIPFGKVREGFRTEHIDILFPKKDQPH